MSTENIQAAIDAGKEIGKLKGAADIHAVIEGKTRPFVVLPVEYEEIIAGSMGAQQGGLTIPDGFTVAIEPIRGVGLMKLEARFRYRIGSGTLQMFYELVRPDDVLDEAFRLLVARMVTGLGETPVLAGAAPVAS